MERRAKAPVGFVPASTGPVGGNISEPTKVGSGVPANPDALEIDDDDD